MKIRPIDGEIQLPLDRTIHPDDVQWTYRPPSKTWEIRLDWVIIEFSAEEFEAFIKTGVAQWDREQWISGALGNI